MIPHATILEQVLFLLFLLISVFMLVRQMGICLTRKYKDAPLVILFCYTLLVAIGAPAMLLAYNSVGTIAFVVGLIVNVVASACILANQPATRPKPVAT